MRTSRPGCFPLACESSGLACSRHTVNGYERNRGWTKKFCGFRRFDGLLVCFSSTFPLCFDHSLYISSSLWLLQQAFLYSLNVFSFKSVSCVSWQIFRVLKQQIKSKNFKTRLSLYLQITFGPDFRLNRLALVKYFWVWLLCAVSPKNQLNTCFSVLFPPKTCLSPYYHKW